MERLVIPGSHEIFFIPSVDFNPENGICEIGGESYLEDTTKFYAPMLEWLNGYCADASKSLVFNFKLTYFNTSSSRSILDFLHILKDFEDRKGKLLVNWFYDKDDIDMEEEIEDYKADSGIDIKFIPVEREQLPIFEAKPVSKDDLKSE